MPRHILAFAVLLGAHTLHAQSSRYVDDFEFVRDTVMMSSAALRSAGVDWKKACDDARGAFQSCANDRDHVVNVMRLLAVLGDSHTGVWRSSVEWQELPSKWDGLYGGGLWFGWEDGRFMLRGIMDQHPLAGKVPLGSALVAVEGVPAWLVFERERQRITRFAGSSSDHSLFSSMGNRLLPFGEKQQIDVTFLTPELRIETVKVARWGPGGKAFYPNTVQLPAGVAWQEGATAGFLTVPWCEKLGYLRITGSMDQKTVAAFDRAFDGLRGMEALLLDCRGMGGGSDGEAWTMAGRLFEKAVPNGSGRRLEPTGSWQFAGPVVMLQDENEVSSAETFTWAVSETKRVISVGRPTGGWGIIPRVFACPSGLVDFRLGVNDRGTPINGIHTEGVGWPPDVLVPYGPVFCAEPDPERRVGLEILRLLHAGLARDDVAEALGELFAGRIAEFRRATSRFAAKAEGWQGDDLAKQVADDLARTLALEVALLSHEDVASPDVRSAARRLPGLERRAKAAKLSSAAARVAKLVKRGRAEEQAQVQVALALGEDGDLDAKTRAALRKRHRTTRLARWLAQE